MSLFASSCAALGFFSISLSFFIFIFRKTKLHMLWAIFNFVVSIWGFGLFFATSTKDIHNAIFWWRISHLGGLFISILFYHTIVILCRSERKLVLFFGYFQAITFTILSQTRFLINQVDFVFGKFYYNIANNLYSFGLFFWFLYAFLGFYELFIALRQQTGTNRSKIKYLLFGFFVGFVGGVTYFIPMYRITFFPIGNFSIPIYCTIATYAILRYRLLDFRIVFTRTGIFIFVYSIVLGIPLLLIYYLQNQLVYFLGLSWWIVPFLCSTALATLGPFLYIYFDKKAQDKLLKEQKSYQNILKSASAGMIRIRKLDLLLKLTAYVVAKIVKIKHVSVYLLDTENQQFSLRASRISQHEGIKYINFSIKSPVIQKLISEKETIVAEEVLMRSKDEPSNKTLVELAKQLSNLGASLVIPSFVEDRLIGILVLGEKRSGKLYSQDDLAVFSVLANQAALAIENAQFYEEIKQTHEQLFQAEKMATIGTMADGLSHQINNRFHALSLIAGDSLDMLKTFDWSSCNDESKQIFSDLKSALERIESNVLQGGEVVKGLLKYSRPGDGGFEAINFKDVINGAIDMVQYKIKLKEIDLIQSLPQDLPTLHANLTQLQEVFFNLIDNAYDAIKERQLTLKEEGYRGKIEISAFTVNGSIEIRVSDNGMGIKDLDRKKLFTPFFTTKATAKKGTGLGLYVIEKIVASHTGKIKIDSAYQKGTSFIITLPIRSA